MAFRFSRRTLLFIVLIVLVIAVPLTLFLLQKQQDIRQHAAGSADLVVSGFQLTDAGGNVRTTFGINEDIYVRVRIKNQGTATGISTDGYTYTQVYSNKPNPVNPGTVSTDGIYLKNGQFGAGYEKSYESRWGGVNSSFYKDKIYFKKSSAGIYTARAYVNYDGKVAESDLTNNQEAIVVYTVTSDPIGSGIYQTGSVGTTVPTGFTTFDCGEQGTNNGISVCYVLGPVNGKGIIKFTNTGSTSQTVGAALYKAYYDYPSVDPGCDPASCPDQYIWIWTQTIYSARTFTLGAGDTRYVSLPAPSCNWQMDAFTGGTIYLSFHPLSQTYGQQGRLIGGGWLEQYNGIQACTPNIIPYPSPTPTSTPTPTLTPSPTLPPDVPTPTVTETPTPTDTPTLTPVPPTETPTPTDQPVCVVPSQVQNVKIQCPFCGQ